MQRKLKLLINLLICAVFLNYSIVIMIQLLNPRIQISMADFFTIFLDLMIFYVPLWIISLGIIFFIFQFFAEKKFPIGIINPPTIIYFLSFTILLSTIIYFLNYDYYFSFFTQTAKLNFIKVILLNLIMVIFGILYISFRKLHRQSISILFIIILIINSSAAYVLVSRTKGTIPDSQLKSESGSQTSTDVAQRDKGAIGLSPGFEASTTLANQLDLSESPPTRRIRLFVIDGISLNYLVKTASDQKLPNFNLLIKKGVRGRIVPFSPNLNLSLLNTVLSGNKPSEYQWHSDFRFKLTDIEPVFDIFPRYIFFRNSANINTISFSRQTYPDYIDDINNAYTRKGLLTYQLLKPDPIPLYSGKSLAKNTRFMILFSNILTDPDPKYEIIRRAFFLDEYINNLIPEFRDGPLHYSLVLLPGLERINKFFYRYHVPDLIGGLEETEIEKYGWVIEKYYEYYDSIIGKLTMTMGENELLVIFSRFEYEPMPLFRRMLANLLSRNETSVYKASQAEGTILLFEKNALKKDYPLKNTSIYDIFPTLLYYSGFQLSRDLKGEVIREIFVDEFLMNNPINIQTGFGINSKNDR